MAIVVSMLLVDVLGVILMIFFVVGLMILKVVLVFCSLLLMSSWVGGGRFMLSLVRLGLAGRCGCSVWGPRLLLF